MSRRPDPVASRHAILEAARECFSATGYAGTSMHDIAAAAGVTQSLIHHHFGPKDALWAEVRCHAFGQYLAQQRAVVEAIARDADQLRYALEGYFRFLAARPDVLRLVAWLELDGVPAEPGPPQGPSGASPGAPTAFFGGPSGSSPGAPTAFFGGPSGSSPSAPKAAVDLRSELRALHEHGTRVLEGLQAQGRVRRDLPARHLLVAILGLFRNWFEERNLVQDESDPKQVAEVDAAYLRTLWAVIGEGLLVRPRVRPEGPLGEIASGAA